MKIFILHLRFLFILIWEIILLKSEVKCLKVELLQKEDEVRRGEHEQGNPRVSEQTEIIDEEGT